MILLQKNEYTFSLLLPDSGLGEQRALKLTDEQARFLYDAMFHNYFGRNVLVNGVCWEDVPQPERAKLRELMLMEEVKNGNPE